MNHFWGNLFESFKERRNVVIFFWGLAALPLVILAGAGGYVLFQALNLAANWPLTLPELFLLLVILVWRGLRRARERRLNRYKNSPLSRDELAKARSKLKMKSTCNFKS
jgi:hypothetical protein